MGLAGVEVELAQSVGTECGYEEHDVGQIGYPGKSAATENIR